MKLFGKRNELAIGNKILQDPPLVILFDLNFEDNEKQNTGTITLYNLAPQTIELFKKGASLVLKSGYIGDIGTISTYAVKECNAKTEGVDRLLEVVVGEEDGKWQKTLINKTWKAGIAASQIIKDIVNGLGLTLGELTLPVDLKYNRGKTFAKAAKLCLSELVKDCKAKMIFSRGTIYIRPPENGKVTGFVLNKESGLIGSPEKQVDDKGKVTYKVKCLMNYQIEVGSIIKVENKMVNGVFKVKKGKYVSNDSDHGVEMEVVAV